MEIEFSRKLEIYCKSLIKVHYGKTGRIPVNYEELLSEGWLYFNEEFKTVQTKIKDFFFKEDRFLVAKKQLYAKPSSYSKKCKDCGKIKDSSDFYKDKCTQTGMRYFRSRCKDCDSEHRKKLYNPERRREYYLKSK